MEYKKPLFGAVSALALASASPGVAKAELPPPASLEDVSRTSVPVAVGSDLVFHFLLTTNGDLRPASAERAVKAMFPTVHAAQAESLPAFVRSLWAVGLSDETRQVVTKTLLFALAESPAIDDAKLERVGAELLRISSEGGSPAYRMAQLSIEDGFCDFSQSEANQALDADCPPLTTEAPPGPTPAGGDQGQGPGGYAA